VPERVGMVPGRRSRGAIEEEMKSPLEGSIA
jgi:hypothetical protein